MSFQYKNSVWIKLFENSFEHEFDSIVTVVQMNPLCNAQTENDIVLRFFMNQKVFIFENVVCLSREMVEKLENQLRNEKTIKLKTYLSKNHIVQSFFLLY